MKTHKDVKVSDYEISLSKILGKNIVDVWGYITKEFGEPTFQMTKVKLEDGGYLDCEGEHDMPYLTNGGKGNEWLDDEVLENIYKTSEATNQKRTNL